MSEASCHFCRQGFVITPDEWAWLPRVTSDCRPARWRGQIAVCPSCGLTQTVMTEGWRKAAETAYEDYEIYAAAGGAEQKIAVDGGMQGRSSALVGHLLSLGRLSSTGRLLDVGCGNGAFLRAFAHGFPEWLLEGSEFNRRNEALLRAIPSFQALHGTDVAELPDGFDMVSLIHVLEHIESPGDFLAALRVKVALGGSLFVEVPSWRNNPFALMIADHASHFTPASLALVVSSSGWEIETVHENWVPKELSLMAMYSGAGGAVRHSDIVGEKSSLDTAMHWLGQVMAEAKKVAGNSVNFGLFGSAIAATWLYQGVSDHVRFFVDEDPQRVGRTHLGLPILAPDQVPADADVFVGISPIVSEVLLERLKAFPGRVHTTQGICIS